MAFIFCTSLSSLIHTMISINITSTDLQGSLLPPTSYKKSPASCTPSCGIWVYIWLHLTLWLRNCVFPWQLPITVGALLPSPQHTQHCLFMDISDVIFSQGHHLFPLQRLWTVIVCTYKYLSLKSLMYIHHVFLSSRKEEPHPLFSCEPGVS